MIARSNGHDQVLHTLRALEAWGSERGWSGPDPYDALNATRLVGPLRRSVLGRRILTQTVKRSPVDLRPLLGVRPGLSSAALAHVASSYALDGFLPKGESLAKLHKTIARLDGLRSPAFAEPCWGYHFDVQTRVFFYPRGAPNAIATAFAAMAFLDAFERSGERPLLEVAAGVGDFFLRHIPQTEAGDGAFFGYLVGDRTPIHNANMLICAALARLFSHTGRTDCRDAAEAGLRYTVGLQRPDGSWPYGEEDHLRWIDGYHTAYVLWALMTCAAARIQADHGEALDRGLAFYRRELFLPDGTPKFTTTSLYPIDSECVAQGIQTFALAAERDPRHGDFAWSIFRFARSRMRRRNGSFIFQRQRLWWNATPHVRWTAASMLLALTRLLHALERRPPVSGSAR